ncbi:MAG: DUF4174 domain-containing protein [Rhodobacteraceae bacterium]|nr:DUF4174 domain-containing protein [Paracoccaceae bacterium]
MKRLSTLLVAVWATLALPAFAAEEASARSIVLDAAEAQLADFLWTARPLVVFADSPEDPRYIQQLQNIENDVDALSERDVVVLVDTDPTTLSPLREALRPRGFMLVLIGKDGGVKLRKPAPWTVRELGRVIDKMPMRQQEIRDRRASGDGS